MSTHRRELVAAVPYLAAFVVLGLGNNFFGPALSQLQDQTGSSEAAISVVFVTSSAGYLAGSFLGGRAFDRSVGQRWIVAALCAVALAYVAVPHLGSLVMLAGVYVVIGFGLGVNDVGANTFVVWQDGEAVASTLNGLHLAFGVGALIVPALVGWSLTGAAAIVTVSTAAVAIWLGRITVPTPRTMTHRDGGAGGWRLGVVAAWFSLYVGFELGYAGWVHTYAEDIGFDAARATGLTVAFWASFTAGRVIAVPLARYLRAQHLLLGSTVIAVVAAVCVLVGDGGGLVWPGTIAIGAGLAPQYATMLALVEERSGLTGSATGWIVVCSGLGGLIVPFLVGQLYDSSRPETVPWVSVVAGTLTLVWMVVVLICLPTTRTLGATATATATA